MRLLAILPAGVIGKTEHYLGLPPELTGGRDTRQALGAARFLVVETKPNGVYLFRYNEHGKCVGDTWHQTDAEAEDQAKFEYSNGALDWFEVPAEITDVVAFAQNGRAS